MKLAVFVSSHGFGHAARVAAVVEAAFSLEPTLEVHLFTSVPEWFFRDSLSGPFSVHRQEVDPGPVAVDAFRTDLGATTARFRTLLDAMPAQSRAMAERLRDLGVDGVLADISPLGIASGAQAGLPTVLLESFTWDQVLSYMGADSPEIVRIVQDLREVFAQADLTVRARPAVERPPSLDPRGPRILEIPPVARPLKVLPQVTRRAIGVPAGVPLVLLTLGGTGGDFPATDPVLSQSKAFFVVPGAAEWRFGPNFVRAPARSGYFHADLVAAADAVVGKLGYSTLAEAYQGRTRYGYVARAEFVETPSLEAWIEDHGLGRPLGSRLAAGDLWTRELDALLSLPEPPPPREGESGRHRAARALLAFLA